MRKLLELIPLFSVEKNGKTRIWRASIHYDQDSGKAFSVIEFGQEGGKMQIVTREYSQGKNIGKKNETSSLEQCTQETQRKWIDKKEKEGYYEHENIRDDRDDKDDKDENENIKDDKDDKEDKEEPIKIYPMLAQTYDPLKKKITYPCFVQPKLDGLRCITYLNNNNIVFQSRTAGHFETMSHLVPCLESIFRNYPSIVLDGELYTTDIPFEELAGLIKKRKLSDDDKERLKYVSYHIYDVVDETLPFSQRYEMLQRVLNTPYRYLKLVPTYVATSPTDFRERFSEFVSNGMEGIMLRNMNGLYRCNYRSNDLQKYKEFLENEYMITGFKEGDGRDKGSIIWECSTSHSSSQKFWVRPRGSMEMRQKWFKEGDLHVGEYLTVIYQELSEAGVPRFPVGKSLRSGF